MLPSMQVSEVYVCHLSYSSCPETVYIWNSDTHYSFWQMLVQLENGPQDLSALATLIYQISLTSLMRLSEIISSVVFTKIILNAEMLIKIQSSDLAYC